MWSWVSNQQYISGSTCWWMPCRRCWQCLKAIKIQSLVWHWHRIIVHYTLDHWTIQSRSVQVLDATALMSARPSLCFTFQQHPHLGTWACVDMYDDVHDKRFCWQCGGFLSLRLATSIMAEMFTPYQYLHHESPSVLQTINRILMTKISNPTADLGSERGFTSSLLALV
jgi:hypothetical protein